MKKIILLLTLFLSMSGCVLFDTPEFVEEKSKEIEMDIYTANSPEEDKTEETSSGKTIINAYKPIISPTLTAKDNKIHDLERNVKKLQRNNESLKKVMLSLENIPLSQKRIKDIIKNGEIKFKQCGSLRGFELYDWYDYMEELLGAQKMPLFKSSDPVVIDFENIASGCYSANGDIFVFLVSGDSSGRGMGVIRYDTKIDTAQGASFAFNNTNFIIPPETFGKRKGNIIELKGTSSANDCATSMHYDYDFIENEVKLIKECAKCPGKTEECKDF